MNQEMNQRIVGATPAGAQDRESASRAVREMFTSIAPRYDLLNHVLSFNIDRLWWWRTARTFEVILQRPGVRVLDLCCGTGDMAFALRRRAGSGSPQIMGADFLTPCCNARRRREEARRCGPCNGSKRTRFGCRFPTDISIW